MQSRGAAERWGRAHGRGDLGGNLRRAICEDTLEESLPAEGSTCKGPGVCLAGGRAVRGWCGSSS